MPRSNEHREQVLEAAALVAGEGDRSGTVMTGLFRTLAHAKGFVHFTSWGVSHLMLGALELVSEQDVHVAGLVSGAYSATLQELAETDATLESLSMDVIGIPRDESRQAPHQKLIVLDGLVAFKGSANLTTTAWRKASSQGELIEVVTDPAEIIRLHNTYFSKAWLKWGRNRLLTVGDVIQMKHLWARLLQVSR